MSRFAADAVALCKRSPNARAITYGAESTSGPIDIEDRLEGDAGGERLVRRTVITIGAAELPSVVLASVPLTIVVDSGLDTEQSYKVRDIQSVEDGELRELICAEA